VRTSRTHIICIFARWFLNPPRSNMTVTHWSCVQDQSHSVLADPRDRRPASTRHVSLGPAGLRITIRRLYELWPRSPVVDSFMFLTLIVFMGSAPTHPTDRMPDMYQYDCAPARSQLSTSAVLLSNRPASLHHAATDVGGKRRQDRPALFLVAISPVSVQLLRSCLPSTNCRWSSSQL
jgi:hypothetical protein